MKRLITYFISRIRGEYTTKALIKRGLKVGQHFNRLIGTIIDPSHCWLIEIGNNVTLAPRVHILAHDASTKLLLGYTRIGQVIIGSNVFIGAESVILPNVSICDNVIIGAGSVVTKSILQSGIYAGDPACFICSYEDYLSKKKKEIDCSKKFSVDYTLRGNITVEKKKEMKDYLKENVGYVE